MKKRCLLLSLGLISTGALANNGDQMLGYSAISNAMGGAVVAKAQDITASLSNPAGLAFLDLGEARTRFDMNVSTLQPGRSLNDVESDSGSYVLATGGFGFQSDTLGDRVTVAVGAYPISGAGVDFPNSAYTTPLGGQAIVASRTSLRIGPGMAYRVNDRWAVGANVSLASNAMSLRRPTPEGGNFPLDVAYGYAYTVGSVYRPSERVQFGAVYTSRSYLEDLEWNMDDGKYSLEFNDPQTVAFGVSYKVTPALQLEADVKWLDYSSVRNATKLEGPTLATTRDLTFGWEDQTVIALGAKYNASDRWTWMVGYNYGESPIDEEDVNNNIGVTAIVEHHLSLGFTSRVTRFSSLSASWMHGFENELTASTLLPFQTTPTKVAFEVDLFTLQFTYQH